MSHRQVIHGFHAIVSRLRHHPGSIQVIYLDETRRDRRAKALIKSAEDKGVRVVEASDDPYVASLIQAHADVVSQFIDIGYEEVRKNHAVPPRPE